MSSSFERFGVTEEQLRALVAEGLRDGGDWCDLYFEDTSYHDLLLRDGVVGSGGYHVDYGCGIRVLKGEKTGYAYAERTDFPSLKAAARAAGAIAAGSAIAGAAESAAASGNRSHPRLRKREGPAGCWDGGQARLSDVSTDSGRGPAQPDVSGGSRSVASGGSGAGGVHGDFLNQPFE